MLEKFAKYFLDNQKITLVAITAISFFGILSYALLPKQYNPSIVAPAFEITVPVRGYSSADSSRLVVREIENRLAELEGIDDLYGYSGDEFASVMASFEVGTDAEKAKARLYDKLSSNYALRPYGIEAMNIRSIDPEDLPQVVFAVRYQGSALNQIEAGIYVRAIANLLKNEVKKIFGTSALDVVWGYPNAIAVKIDPDKVRSLGMESVEIVGILKSTIGYRTVGSISEGNASTLVALDGGWSDMESLKNLVVSGGPEGSSTYLRDIAEIVRWPAEATEFAFHSDERWTWPSAFLGISKSKGTNAVDVVERVVERVEKFRSSLPGDVSVEIVSNEGETAKHATNELLFHLFVSIVIVFGVLVLFLGLRNAANAAFCIPLVLGIVFIVAFVFGLDINRITLFALILSLGILVDDSIVVVENNARHLAERGRDGRTKKQAILDSVREVGVSIVLSTITRIVSFLGMFAVTGMMGDYMEPIPVFAAIALTASLFVAFSINPFMAHALDRGNGHQAEEDAPILAHYARFLKKFVGKGEAEKRRRRWLKPAFWTALVLVVTVPIAVDAFRARMLPKADKDQVYVWIDLPRDQTAVESEKAARLVSDFLFDREGKLGEDLRVVTAVASISGERFLPDFANLFRWSQNRSGEHQTSMRISLSKERDISSEAYVIKIRPLLREAFLKEYPDAKIRLLEDPPGPPAMATFHVKLKGEEGLASPSLVRFAEAVQGIVSAIAQKEGVEDLENSLSSALPKLRVRLDGEKMAERHVDAASVEAALVSALSENRVGIAETGGKSPEAEEITVSIPRKYREDPSSVGAITVKSRLWRTVRIDEIATFEPDYAGNELHTEGRSETVHLYAEIGANSVVYPVLSLYGEFEKPDFASKYRKTGSWPYGIDFVGVEDAKSYRLEWGGEWELTMDTFRDMGLAMILSLLAIYLLVVGEFKSFRVGGIVMMTFLFSFFGIFPGFALLGIVSDTYFTATAMIGAIALGGIVVGNAIIMLDYVTQLFESGKSLEDAVVEGSKKRVVPVLLTSAAAVLGSIVIAADPVWSGLAWAIAFGLSSSALLTLFLVPVFFYDLRLRTWAPVSGRKA